MSPLQQNSLVEKREENCALGQGKYTWQGSFYTAPPILIPLPLLAVAFYSQL